MRPTSRLSLALFALGLTTGCSTDAMMKMDAGLGVTQGGVQDMGLARAIIEGGGIPSAEHYTAEGLFSEHDLTLDGAPCEQLLCPRVAVAQVQTVGSDTPELLAQLGFATDIDPETFERDALDLVVAVDISSSMAGEKIGATRSALRALVDRLDAGDRLGIVAFDDRVQVRADLTVVDEGGREALLRQIDGLEVNGGTWIEGGLERSFELVDAVPAEAGVSKRVMIFTDAQPNVGDTRPSSFLGMARTYADRDIGLTSFGVGLDLGAELTAELAKIRGGSSFTLGDRAAIESVFDDDFDFLVTPIAYDLDVAVTPADGLTPGVGYGAPTDPAGAVRFGASTLFLSSDGGGMGIKLAPVDPSEAVVDEEVVAMALSYTPADGGAPQSDAVRAAFEGGAAFQLVEDDQVVHAADQAGVFAMAVLIDELAALDLGAGFCEGSVEDSEATALIEQAADRLEDSGDLLASDALGGEAELMRMLADNVRAGAGGCW